VASSLELLFPNDVKVEIIELESRNAFMSWLPKAQKRLPGSEGHTTSPICFLNDKDYIGGCEEFLEFSRKKFSGRRGPSNAPVPAIPKKVEESKETSYDFDLVVIGGGSGGLSAGKEAAELGAKVALLDFVKPSPQGTSWGLGGTCVNVGCIPKKIFHHAALSKEFIEDAQHFGWKVEAGNHDWNKLVDGVRNYIKSLNFGYKVQLRERNVKYINSLGSLLDEHTIKAVNKKGKEQTITAERILIAVGGRPKQLECPGGNLAITSDDMFFLSKPPGRTLVVGASYVALECASFLIGFGYDTTVMVRSILLRGFDQQMAEMVGAAMEKMGTKFIRETVPRKLEKTGDGKIKVFWDGGEDVFDTVLVAIGRHADTGNLGLENVGLRATKSGKLKTAFGQTEVPSIFSIGDCEEGVPELTPVAIALGRNLAHRLYGDVKTPTNLMAVPTAVFAGLEYSCVGMSEEAAREKFGSAVDAYHTHFTPLQWTVPDNREYNQCYAKVVIDTSRNNLVLGIHLLSPEAGEIVQAYGVAIKFGMTFQDLKGLIGIHPTIGEELCLLTEPKSSGKEAIKSGC